MIIAEAVPSPHEYLTSGRRAAPGTPPGGRIISGRLLSKASGKRADRPGEAPPSWPLLAETPLPGASPPAASHKAAPVGSESQGPAYRVCGSGAHPGSRDSDRLLDPDIVEISRQLASGIRRTRLRQALCGMHIRGRLAGPFCGAGVSLCEWW